MAGFARTLGPWKTAHERLRTWTADGTWERIMDRVVVKDDSVGNVESTISVDSSKERAGPPACLLPSLDSRRAARARDPVHLPRTCRPDPAVPSQRLPRWPPTRVRPGHLRRAQRGRALLQPAQAVPRPGHPLRQTRRLLPRRDHRRRDRGVAAQRPTGHGLAAGPSGSPNRPSTPPSRSNHPPRAKCSSAAPGRRTTRFATREGREGMALVAGPRRDREVDA